MIYTYMYFPPTAPVELVWHVSSPEKKKKTDWKYMYI